MELFFYSCDAEAPFRELYKSLGSQNNKLLISNQKKHISKFENYKDRILYEAIGDDVTDKKILVPIHVKKIFLEWVKEKYGNNYCKVVKNINIEEFHLTGADEINNFIQEMNVEEGWEDIMKYENNKLNNDVDKSFKIQEVVTLPFFIGFTIAVIIVVTMTMMYFALYVNPWHLRMEEREAFNEVQKVFNEGKNFNKAKELAEKSLEKYNNVKSKQILIAIHEIEQAKEQRKVQESFLQGDYKLAKNLAHRIDKKYYFAKKIIVAIDEIKAALLHKANKALKRKDLTTPEKNNVKLFAEQVLKIYPNDKKAIEELRKAIEKYISIIKKDDKNTKKWLNAVKNLEKYYTLEQTKEINVLQSSNK